MTQLIFICPTWKDCVRQAGVLSGYFTEQDWIVTNGVNTQFNVTRDNISYLVKCYPLTSKGEGLEGIEEFWLIEGSSFSPDFTKYIHLKRLKGKVQIRPNFALVPDNFKF